jgi:hypothetical protein
MPAVAATRATCPVLFPNAVLFNAYSSNGESLDVETQLRPIVSQLASTARAMGRDEADIEPVCLIHT